MGATGRFDWAISPMLHRPISPRPTAFEGVSRAAHGGGGIHADTGEGLKAKAGPEEARDETAEGPAQGETGTAANILSSGRNRGAQPQNHNATRHGLYAMKLALKEIGTQPLDGRSAVAQALRRYQDELISDLGGDPSTAQRTLVDLAGRQKLLLDTIDSWVMQNPAIAVDGADVRLVPVIKEREQIAANLAKYLNMLGLERRQKSVTDLAVAFKELGRQ